jgi:hypothetical protein
MFRMAWDSRMDRMKRQSSCRRSGGDHFLLQRDDALRVLVSNRAARPDLYDERNALDQIRLWRLLPCFFRHRSIFYTCTCHK